MLVKIFAAIAISTTFGLVAISNASAEHGFLSGDQIKKLRSGSTNQGRLSSGLNFKVRTGEDGSQTFEAENGFSDVGKWWIEEDRWCTQWSKIRKGKKACSTWKHISGNKYVWKNTDGSNSGTAKISK